MEIFANPERLWLLAIVPAGVIAAALAARARRLARARYGGQMDPARLAPGLWPGGWVWRTAAGLAGALFLVLAMARPQWGERVEPVLRRGVDIVVALDTSRSMACEDVKPSRFERARLAVSDLLSTRAGDRVALLPFSQWAGVTCPLTLDYGAVRLFLDAAEIAPEGTQGTDLGKAIRMALQTLGRGERKHKVIVLLTDGEDHAGEAVAEARRAREEGAVIFALAAGGGAGGPIPVRDESGRLLGYHRDREGRVVTTRLDTGTLERVCAEGGGRSFALDAAGAAVGSLAAEIDRLEKKEQKGLLATRREERYRWPLVAAMIFLTAETMLPRRRRGGA